MDSFVPAWYILSYCLGPFGTNLNPCCRILNHFFKNNLNSYLPPFTYLNQCQNLSIWLRLKLAKPNNFIWTGSAWLGHRLKAKPGSSQACKEMGYPAWALVKLKGSAIWELDGAWPHNKSDFSAQYTLLYNYTSVQDNTVQHKKMPPRKELNEKILNSTLNLFFSLSNIEW